VKWEVVPSFHQAVTGDKKFISRAGPDGSGIVPNPQGDTGGAAPDLLEEVVDPANESKLSDV